jgi:putative AdoMet-dependent methyltransferase
MLALTRSKWPQVKAMQGDLLAKWPSALQAPFERIVSAYVFHEFDLATKIALLKKAVTKHLTPGGRMIVADIAFETIETRAEAHERLKLDWDEDEFYWAADETVRACKATGLQANYQQVSLCGGIFIFTDQPL